MTRVFFRCHSHFDDLFKKCVKYGQVRLSCSEVILHLFLFFSYVNVFVVFVDVFVVYLFVGREIYGIFSLLLSLLTGG